MWELDFKESWVPKNWCLWTEVLEKTLESLWTSRRSNQSILMEISPGYLLEGLLLKMKLQYFGHLMWRTDSFGKTLMLRKIEGRRSRWLLDGTRLDGHEFEQVLGVGEGQGSLAHCSQWGHKESDTTEWLNWTDNGINNRSWLFSPELVIQILYIQGFTWLPFKESFLLQYEIWLRIWIISRSIPLFKKSTVPIWGYSIWTKH